MTALKVVTSHDHRNGYAKAERLIDRHDRLMFRLRKALGRKTLGSDERIYSRAHHIAETVYALHRVHTRLRQLDHAE
jgi:hypothetical protein